jgi:hypothetical protein
MDAAGTARDARDVCAVEQGVEAVMRVAAESLTA